MGRTIITISDNGTIIIPRAEIWMSKMELVELFGVIAPTLRATKKPYTKTRALPDKHSKIQFRYSDKLGNILQP